MSKRKAADILNVKPPFCELLGKTKPINKLNCFNVLKETKMHDGFYN